MTEQRPFEQTRRSFEEAADGCGVGVEVLQLARVDVSSSSKTDDILIIVKDGDTIDNDGLAALRRTFRPSSQLCIFDSYYFDKDRAFPVLQPGVNIPYIRSVDATFSRFALRVSLFDELLRNGCSREPREILLRALEAAAQRGDPNAIVHCAAPVLKMPNLTDDLRALRETLIMRSPLSQNRKTPNATVSVVICTKNNGHLVEQLVRALVSPSCEGVVDVAIVANQTSNLFAKRTLAYWNAHPKVKVVDHDGSFNFSAQCNAGAAKTVGEFILFLNDDIVPVSDRWTEDLLAPFVDPAVGAVGPLLLYPNGKVQHAGMFMGYRNAAGHTLRDAVFPDGDYLFMGTAEREVSCITGAALMTRRSIFDDLNGFDTQLSTIFQDIDLCLRIRNLGYRIHFNPRSILLHMESISILPTLVQAGMAELRGQQHQYLLSRYSADRLKHDPYVNPGHNRHDETLHNRVDEAA